MTRIAILVLRPRPGAPDGERGHATVWYGNGKLRGDHVLDDILALRSEKMPPSGTGFEGALRDLGYGEPPVYLEVDPEVVRGHAPFNFSEACDWMFDECDQFVVAHINADDLLESVYRLDRYWAR